MTKISLSKQRFVKLKAKAGSFKQFRPSVSLTEKDKASKRSNLKRALVRDIERGLYV